MNYNDDKLTVIREAIGLVNAALENLRAAGVLADDYTIPGICNSMEMYREDLYRQYGREVFALNEQLRARAIKNVMKKAKEKED